jgi:hypothetical protein
MATPSNRAQLERVLTKPNIDPVTAQHIAEETRPVLDIELSTRVTGARYEPNVVRDTPPPPGKIAYLCAYCVDVTPAPYVRFLLYKYPGDDGHMAFPIIARDTKGGDALLEQGGGLFERCCSQRARCTGYVEHDDALYLLYHYSGAPSVQAMGSSHKLWWALMTEMCNENAVITYSVHPSVYRMFYEHPSLTRVTYADGRVATAPKALYYGAGVEDVAYAAVFGVQQADPSALFGPFYYYAPFQRAVRYAGWDYKRSSRKTSATKQEFLTATRAPDAIDHGGIVRYAVFTGNSETVKVVLAHPGDPEDASESTAANLAKHKDKLEHLSKEDIGRLRRSTDRDANWASEYDALYAGPLRSAAGHVLTWAHVPVGSQNPLPIYVTKDFRQQTPMTTHTLDRSAVGETWSPTGTYSIV